MKVITKIYPDLGEVFEYEGIKVKCVEDNIYIAGLAARIALSVVH